MKVLPSLAALLVSVSSCKKDNLDLDGLVPATQEGRNTGDFLLNGLPWGPKASTTSPGSPIGARWDKIRGGREITLILGRYKNQNDRAALNIILPYITAPATFHLTDAVNPFVVPGSGRNFMVYDAYLPSPERYFLTGPTAVGRVVVTRYDTVAHIVSGTFEAKLREYNGPDSLIITKGRFDSKF